MGMCLDPIGKISIEVRRESFRIACEDDDGSEPNPEYSLDVLDDLIAALHEAKRYVSER